MDANADACFDRLVVRLRAFDKGTTRLITRLKATGDCSIIDKMLARDRMWFKMVRSSGCDVTLTIRPEKEIRREFGKYCKAPKKK